MGLIELY